MDLYDKLKTNKSIDSNDFIKMISTMFNHEEDDNIDDSLTYVWAGKIAHETDYEKVILLMNKFPIILKTFLLHPSRFSEFLENILQPSLQNMSETFYCRDEEANICHLICMITFHLAKLYTMIGHQISKTKKDNLHKMAATYFCQPLGKWLSNLILFLQGDFVYGSFTTTFLNEIEYLLVMQFVAKELPFADWPVVKFLTAIKTKWSKKEDRLDQFNIWFSGIAKFLLDHSDSNSDKYDNHIMGLYTEDYDGLSDDDSFYIHKGDLINWNNFVHPTDVTQSVFVNDYYNISDFVRDQYINEKDRSIMRAYNNDNSYYNNLYILLMMIYAVGPQVVFDMTPNNTIRATRQWSDIAEEIMNMFDGYLDNVERNTKFIFTMLFSKNFITYNQLFHEDERRFVARILINVYNNDHQNNHIFIRKLLKALLTHDFSHLKTNAFDFLKGHETDELITKYMSESVLTRLFYVIDLDENDENSSFTIPDLETRRSIFEDDSQITSKDKSYENKSSMSLKTHSYDVNKKAQYFKDIIKGLLKLEVSSNRVTKVHLNELYKYKKSLKDVLDINLDDYKFEYLGESPVSLSLRSRRSVDKYSPAFRIVVVNDKNNAKKKKVKIGNQIYDMDAVKFIDKTTIQIDDMIYYAENKNDNNLKNLEQDGNIFKKKIPLVYKKPDFKIITVQLPNNRTERKIKIGNAIYELHRVTFMDENTIQLNHNKYITQDVPFANKNLQRRLLRHYSRTVEGMDAGEYGGANRIIKIRTYLQKKYPLFVANRAGLDEIIVHTEHDRELETLLGIWNTKALINLNTKYFVKYFTMMEDENGNPVQTFDDGIDQGGLTKNFLTKCAKQLKAKFFKPAYEGSERYILNNAGLQNARFIAAFLATCILKEIYLDFNLSIVYLAFLMFRTNDITNEEIFLYFLLDIDSDTRYNSYLKYCENTYTYESEEDENYYFSMACNPKAQVEDSLKYIYNLDHDGFKEFCKAFLIENKIFYRKFKNINSKIRIYDLDKLLSMGKLSKKDLKRRIFDQVLFDDDGSEEHTNVYQYLENIMINDKKEEYAKMYSEYAKENKGHFKDDNDKMKTFEDLENSQTFKKKVLMFWTGSQGILSEEYKISIEPDLGKMPVAHTCYNQLDLPTDDKIKSKQELYNSFMDIFIGSGDENFNNA